MPKRFHFAPCCRAAIGTIWWMRGNTSAWQGSSGGIVGPAHDGWASNVEVHHIDGHRSRPIYKSTNVDACPHCGTNLRPLKPIGPGMTRHGDGEREDVDRKVSQ